ncbi:hypothetical protein D3C85_1384920 [compost metagenome]
MRGYALIPGLFNLSDQGKTIVRGIRLFIRTDPAACQMRVGRQIGILISRESRGNPAQHLLLGLKEHQSYGSPGRVNSTALE